MKVSYDREKKLLGYVVWLVSYDDVITPRQQPCKHVHVSPTPRQRHVIG